MTTLRSLRFPDTLSPLQEELKHLAGLTRLTDLSMVTDECSAREIPRMKLPLERMSIYW